jgi:ribosomal protein L37E
MVFCKRCGRKHKDSDNYCSYCGVPLKSEILKMVQQHFEKHRKESVHNVLTVLVKEKCIVPEKLNYLMEKLEKMFGSSEAKSVSK